MCRITSTDLYDAARSRSRGGFRLFNIKAFYIKLHLLSSPDLSAPQQLLQDSHVLLYLPRLNKNNNHCGAQLYLDEDVEETKVSHNSPGYFSLQRFTTQTTISNTFHDDNCVLFGTKEKFQVEEGAMFSVYLNGEKLLKGIFKKATGENIGWTIDSTGCLLEGQGFELSRAEVSVVPAGGGVLGIGLSTMTSVANLTPNLNQNRKPRLRRRISKFQGLERIPEEGEAELECGSSEDHVDEDLCPGEEAELEAGMEGLSWAVDLGIWAVGLGLGYMVSRASAKRLRRLNVF